MKGFGLRPHRRSNAYGPTLRSRMYFRPKTYPILRPISPRVYGAAPSRGHGEWAAAAILGAGTKKGVRKSVEKTVSLSAWLTTQQKEGRRN
jgi:hypothetical protein